MADGRLRMTVLGGYLGAGKTTWLRHQLHLAGKAAPHVIVNEAAGTPVDHRLLDGAGGVTVLGGGCACCTARDDLSRALRGLADLRSRNPAAVPDAVVLETSGLADPGPIAAAIQDDPVLVHHLRLVETVVLVDALHGLDTLAGDALGQRQVTAADRLILTKTGGADRARLSRVAATLRQINPAAGLTAADHGVPCALDIDPCAVPVPLPQSGTVALEPHVLAFGAPVDWAVFGLWLSALLHHHGDRLVRVKGVIRSPAGRLLVQAVRRVVQPPEILPDTADDEGDDRLAILGRGVTADALWRSWQHFAGH